MVELEHEYPRGLDEFEEDSRWFYKNINLLRKEGFTGKFVAIKNKSIIAGDKELDIVIKTLEERGEDPACIIIEFVYPKEAVILL